MRFCVGNFDSPAQDLKSVLLKRIGHFKGIVSVAVKNLAIGDTLSINGNRPMVMASVFKFPIALAVLHQVDLKNLKLEQGIRVGKADLVFDNSILKERYLPGASIFNIDTLLQFMISHSDNNACDLLVKQIGGMRYVEAYIRSLGIRDMSLKANETAMRTAWSVQYTDWCKSPAILRLIDLSYRGHILSGSSTKFLWKCMAGTTTGINRLKGLLPSGTYVAHKTGSSDTNDKGLSPATNDVGIIRLRNGNEVEIAVMITDSYENEAHRDLLIAKVAKVVWDHYERIN